MVTRKRTAASPAPATSRAPRSSAKTATAAAPAGKTARKSAARKSAAAKTPARKSAATTARKSAAPRKAAAPAAAPQAALPTAALPGAEALKSMADQVQKAGAQATEQAQSWARQMQAPWTELMSMWGAPAGTPRAPEVPAALSEWMQPQNWAKGWAGLLPGLAGAAGPGAGGGLAAGLAGLPGLPKFDTGSLDPQAMSATMAEMWRSMSGVSVAPEALANAQLQYMNEAAQLWNEALMASVQGAGEPAKLKDRRFSAPAWSANPMSRYMAQMYLLNARTMMQLAEAVQADAKTKARVRFAVSQWVDAMSPSNFLWTNPEAIDLAVQTKGESLARGMQLLIEDVKKGHVSQTDESVFEVGRNVATTEGAVVFENDLFQLLEYKPLTRTVHERPMLFVPPCINKYYILDLQPENSVIRHTVEQGHRLFVVSWRNPDDSMKALTWDDYIERGPIAAIGAVQSITGQDDINALGFCVGGTIMTTALAVLAARGEHPVHALTLLTTLLDFEETGVLDIFVDEAAVQLREMTIGEKSPTGPGLLNGKELATTFSFLRPNDLVWNYVVGNYLKGQQPPAFDLLYWNGDSTNLPGPMYCWYLRHMYLQNDLRKPGALTVCGEKVDIGAIRAKVFIYASREDHIVPWDAAYKSTALFKTDRTFVLGASGHIAGVINPPKQNKRSYWVNSKLPAKAEDWFEGATEKPGSWWPVWSAWLQDNGGRQIAAPTHYGDGKRKSYEPAPGRYVQAKV